MMPLLLQRLYSDKWDGRVIVNGLCKDLEGHFCGLGLGIISAST
jgi:hypothetical protein